MRTLRLKRTLILAAIGITLCLGVELVSRAILTYHRHAIRMAQYSRLDAYKDSAYWSPEFVEEFNRIDADVWEWNERGFRYARDAVGKWTNFKGGERVTIGQPARYTATVYLFGNSSLAGTGVPDEHTITSYLQRLMPEYRIVNYGVSAGLASHSYARLQATPIVPGDVVIFYGGAMDAWSVYVQAQSRRGTEAGDRLCDVLLSRYSYIDTYELPCPESAAPSAILDISRLHTMIGQTVRSYQEAVVNARVYAQSKGARFINILQSHIWSKPLSEYERGLMQYESEQLDRVFLLAWSAIQATPDTLDFTHTLDDLRASGREVWFDFIHHNEYANEALARAIFDAIQP